MSTTVSVTPMVSYGGSIDTSQPDGVPPTAATWDSVTSKPVFAPVAMSGSYADLLNKPAMFSGAYSELTNKPVLFSGAYADLSGRPLLFSGSYADLANKPASFPSAWGDVTGKPALFSGAYADLTGKPTLFSGSYSDLSNKPQMPRAIRAQTNAAGVYVWTFTEQFPDGVIPIVDGFVEDSTAGAMFSVKSSAVTNKTATIQVTKSVNVTVAGISVLGAGVGAQVMVHLTALSPNP